MPQRQQLPQTKYVLVGLDPRYPIHDAEDRSVAQRAQKAPEQVAERVEAACLDALEQVMRDEGEIEIGAVLKEELSCQTLDDANSAAQGVVVCGVQATEEDQRREQVWPLEALKGLPE
ncbi:hypothetical protein SLS55_010460 [Diplodia seriata]|uniref:Uncharacterized protein n=1 Tax=Diplodia seriata TaxID=420778 RepID=A0ABR3BYK6_9PEZI